MAQADPTPPERSGNFPTTHWSLIARAREPDANAKRAALNELLTRYLPALQTHLVVRKRLPTQAAEDLLQGFVAQKVLECGLVEKANREQGRFRTWLLTALDNYVISEWRRASAAKRAPDSASGGAVEELADELAADSSPSDVFDIAWARRVIDEALRRMQAECTAKSRPELWGVFESRIVNPTFTGAEPPPYEEIVARFHFPTPTQAANVLTTGKRMFARLLRAVVGEYARDEAEIDEEIRDLHEILAKARA